MKSPFLGRLVAFLFAGFPAAADACSVCMGDPASKTAGALNNAVFLMLGFITLMLCAIGAFIFNLMRRANASTPSLQSDTHEPPTA
jgi:hypothetical protein